MTTTTLDRLIALTRDLMHIPSVESRPEDRARCFALCRSHLETVPDVEIREYESRGFASMVATARGVEVPAILLVGHLVIAPMFFFPFMWEASAWIVAPVALISLTALVLIVLPRIKGGFMGLLWANRITGDQMA